MWRKNLLPVLLPLLALLFLFGGAGAEEAEDITAQCAFRLCSTKRGDGNMRDRKYTSYWESNKIHNPFVTITSETPIHGLYLCFRKMPSSYEIQTFIPNETEEGEGEGEWQTVAQGDTRFEHVYYALEGLTSVRILSTQTSALQMGFNAPGCSAGRSRRARRISFSWWRTRMMSCCSPAARFLPMILRWASGGWWPI